MGTFGGPESYINGYDLLVPHFGDAQDVNDAGTLVAWADTSQVDPYCKSGNRFGNSCFNLDQRASWVGQIGCPGSGHVSYARQDLRIRERQDEEDSASDNHG